MKNTKKMSMLVMFISLSVVGGFIKIPSPIGSIALDSMPALVAGVMMGPVFAGIVGAMGHMMSALIAGFPLGPAHVLIAVEMAILIVIFAMLIRKKVTIIAYLFFFVGNAFIAPLPFIWIVDRMFYIATVPYLALATGINVVIAAIIAPRLVKWKDKGSE